MHRTYMNPFDSSSRVAKKLSHGALMSLALGVALPSIAAQEKQSLGQGVSVSVESEASVLAGELLSKGDAAYNASNYDVAVNSYRDAVKLIGGSQQSQQVQDAVKLRFAQAAVEQSKVYIGVGSYSKAESLLSEVLADGMIPKYKPANKLLAQIDDPIRNNLALSPESTENADSVRRLLYKAEGYLNLGKFDDALVTYEEVLLIDSTNVAARRGMEKIIGLKSEYYRAANDHARAEMLAEVDAAWETPLPPKSFSVDRSDEQMVNRVQEVYANKLRQIVVPIVDLQDVTIQEAYDMVRVWSTEYDNSSADETEKGTNFVLNLGDPSTEASQAIRAKRISLNLRNVPLVEVLDFISAATSTRWYKDQHLVRVTPLGEADSTIYSRTYKVPPMFMKDAVAASNASGGDDPFSDGASSSAGAATAQDLLQQVGVQFPDGASAKYIKRTGSLMVANTQTNLDLIEEYVRTFTSQEQAQVVLKVSIIDVARDDLEELGFDWLVNQLGGGNLTAGGGTQGNGFPIKPPGSTDLDGFNPVTAGNRSGDSSFDISLNDLVAAGATGVANSGTISQDLRAPGILTLRTEDVAVIMRGLDQKKNSDSLDRPSVIMRSGEKATILSGREMLYPSEYEPPEVPTSVGTIGSTPPVTPSHPTAFESRFVGVEMEAECTISEDKNYVDVQVVASTTDFDGFVDYGSPISTTATNEDTGELSAGVINNNNILMPIFRPFKINTSVTVRDGYSFVIGGLNQSDIETVNDKVPILGDMPLVGRFFQNNGIRKTDRALLFFVHVELKDPTGKNWNQQ